jgi:hypothetical protein
MSMATTLASAAVHGAPASPEQRNEERTMALEADEPPTFAALMRANLEPSYLAFPAGFTGLPPLYLETGIVPHFSLFPRTWRVALILTPKVVLRLFREDSEPVKTPSYEPHLTAFFWFQDTPTNPTAYFSASIGHHSNGQSGPFTNPDGSRNHESGSFDTNQITLAVYPVWWKSPFLAWNSIAVEWHPPFVEDADLRSTYGNVRLHWATTIFTTKVGLVSELTGRLTAIADEMQKPTNANTFFARFPVLVRYTMRPPSIDVGFYAAYYQGQDYYNIWYDRFISVFQLGMSGNLSTGATSL